jgi:hypothetical protein
MEQLLLDYVDGKLLVIIPILWALGVWLKAIPNIADWTIPFILLVVSIALATSYTTIFLGYEPASMWMGVMQGFAIAAVQGYVYQLYAQAKHNRG